MTESNTTDSYLLVTRTLDLIGFNKNSVFSHCKVEKVITPLKYNNEPQRVDI
jgi:hypothetical protein